MTAYVALGDSYAAGVGAGERTGESYRTDAGYPLAVGRRAGLDLAYQAVLGATTADVLRDQVVALRDDTRLVTLTVGGNDAGFVPVLLECVRPAWMSDSDPIIDTAVARIRDELPGRLGGVLESVRARSPQARVVITGYPHLFDGVCDCSLLTFVTPEEMRRLGEVADLLAETILAVADHHGVEGVDVRAPFDGHQVCDEVEWIHGLSWPLEESYHPNRNGHEGYAQAVLELLETPAEPRECRVVGGRCEGTAPTFRLPDLLSPRSLTGAAEHGLDPDRVAALGAVVQDESRPSTEREVAARELQAMHESVVAAQRP